MRDYPFDSQTLTWDIRSTIFNNSVVKFLPAAGPSVAASSALLQGISDTDWTFDKYSQAAYTINSGIFADYDLLSISIVATRISTMSSTFLILPICLICAALCLEMFMDPAEGSRLQTPLACITATMGFSFVVSDLCPPVSYNTRMHLMIFQTYIFSVIALACNWFLWYIEACKQRLAASNDGMKSLLTDSQEMANRVKVHLCHSSETTLSRSNVADAKNEPPPFPGHDTAALDPSYVQPVSTVPTNTLQGTDIVRYIHGKAFGSDTAPGTSLSSALEWVGPAGTRAPPTGKSEKTGAFRNGEGVFHDVLDLLAAPEVETFKKLEWGGGPISMFFGARKMTTENAEGWSR